MFIVVLDRPFYPHVEIYETEELANHAATKLRREEHSPDGHNEAKIYVAGVFQTIAIKTYY